MVQWRTMRVWLAYAGLAGVVACVEQEPDRPSATDWTAIGQQLLKSAPKPQYPVHAELEGKVVYLGLDVSAQPIVPGQPFTLTHYWQVKQPVPGWEIFVHLADPALKQFLNADHKAIGGRYPATMWKAGDIIRDQHTVVLPVGWPATRLEVFTGLWRESLRMRIKGPQDDKSRILAASLPVAPSAAKGGAARPALPRLVARRAAGPLTLDGKLDEPSWSTAASTGAFVDTLTGGAGEVRTTARVLWDERGLYVAFENADSDIWTTLTKRDDKLWTQEAVEVFVDADGDGRDYVELQVNPAGTIFDSYLPDYRQNDNAWNSGMQAAVQLKGTLDRRDDQDSAWTVELFVPWGDVRGKEGVVGLRTPPAVGDLWRLNMFRLDAPRDQAQLAVGWSPPLVGDFHKIDRFGELIFGDATGATAAASSSASPSASPAAPVPATPPAAAKVARPAAAAAKSAPAAAPVLPK
ncbi:MAG: carbohydrate-binding family 9-like protein [Proteobacteria bacterium]|nr:carbohydrate-binding family 9-like protein [Pseudomonadota bacterium]